MPATPLGAVMGLAGGALLAGFYHHLPAHGGGRNSQGVSAVNLRAHWMTTAGTWILASCALTALTGESGKRSSAIREEIEAFQRRLPAS